MADELDLPWLPTFRLRQLRRRVYLIARDTGARIEAEPVVVLQQLYRNADNSTTEWRDVPVVEETEDLLTSSNATVETSRRRE